MELLEVHSLARKALHLNAAEVQIKAGPAANLRVGEKLVRLTATAARLQQTESLSSAIGSESGCRQLDQQRRFRPRCMRAGARYAGASAQDGDVAGRVQFAQDQSIREEAFGVE